MSEHQSTHDIAEQTGAGEAPKPDVSSGSSDADTGVKAGTETEGEADQLQPDGR